MNKMSAQKPEKIIQAAEMMIDDNDSKHMSN